MDHIGALESAVESQSAVRAHRFGELLSVTWRMDPQRVDLFTKPPFARRTSVGAVESVNDMCMHKKSHTHEQKSLKNEFILVSLMSESSVIPSVQVPRPSIRRTPRKSKFSGTDSRPLTSVFDLRVSLTQLFTQVRMYSNRPNEMRKRRLKMIASSDEGSRSRSRSRSIIRPQVLSEYLRRPVRFDLPGRGSVRWSTFSSFPAAMARTRASFALAASIQEVSRSSSLVLFEGHNQEL
jgi:hypothetical protein